jgi:hypothetical protein
MGRGEFWHPRRGQESVWYDVAQICLNGHVTNSSSGRSPEFNQKFCRSCGASTITKCPDCTADIRGYCHVPGVIGFQEVTAPPFCVDCGAAYPWTKGRLDAARELAMEQDLLTSDEREILAKSLDDLVRDTPRTGLATMRFKKLAAKAGSAAASGLKDILVSVVTDAAKKQIWPGA